LLWVLQLINKAVCNFPQRLSFFMSYSELLKHPFWQKKRLEIFQRDNFACRECTDTISNLQVHHLYYTKDTMPWDYPGDAMITVCGLCHLKLEFYKFLKKHARLYLLFSLKLSIDDTEEVLELIRRRVKENHYHDDVIEYMSNIKTLLNG
jgi:hypothetical protein